MESTWLLGGQYLEIDDTICTCTHTHQQAAQLSEQRKYTRERGRERAKANMNGERWLQSILHQLFTEWYAARVYTVYTGMCVLSVSRAHSDVRKKLLAASSSWVAERLQRWRRSGGGAAGECFGSATANIHAAVFRRRNTFVMAEGEEARNVRCGSPSLCATVRAGLVYMELIEYFPIQWSLYIQLD